MKWPVEEEWRRGYLVERLLPFAEVGAEAYVSTRHGPEGDWDLRERQGASTTAEARRHQFLSLFSFQPAEVYRPEQVHGSRVVLVDGQETEAGCRVIPDADGLVTTRENRPLFGLFADCSPIFLVAPNRAVGLVHAGWRGTVAGVIQSAIAIFAELGVEPRELRAAIGPHIHSECYPVGEEVREVLLWRYPWAENRISPEGLLDLGGLQVDILQQAGLPRPQILGEGPCTRCRIDRYHSHRGEGSAAGRFGALIWLGRKRPVAGEYVH